MPVYMIGFQTDAFEEPYGSITPLGLGRTSVSIAHGSETIWPMVMRVLRDGFARAHSVQILAIEADALSLRRTGRPVAGSCKTCPQSRVGHSECRQRLTEILCRVRYLCGDGPKGRLQKAGLDGFETPFTALP